MFYTFPRRFVTETPGNRVRDTVSLTLDGSVQNGHAMKKKNGHAERTCHEKKKKEREATDSVSELVPDVTRIFLAGFFFFFFFFLCLFLLLLTFFLLLLLTLS